MIADTSSDRVGYAPEDAFVEGSRFPFYGSEDKWNRRFFEGTTLRFYGRRGQRQMLDIVEGRPEEAIRYCRKLLEEDPDDLESWFNLAVAQTRIGEITAALESVRSALKKGLPLSRFVAGPRDLLGPLTKTAGFRNLVESRDVRLVHGPMLGCLASRSVRVWVRTAEESKVRVTVFRPGQSGRVASSAEGQTTARGDFTVSIPVTGLTPDTTYFYRITLDGKELHLPFSCRFRTPPPEGKPVRFRVAFGGGAGYNPPNERMWQTISSRNVDALFLLGDNVYLDLPEIPGPFHRYTYYRRQSRPEFRNLISSVPVYAVWDDHDAGMDDIWLGPFRDRPVWKRPMLALFQQNWNNPAAGTAEWPGCWFRWSIGDVDFFFLDGRMYRTNPYAPQSTLLGRVQKKWLLEELQESNAAFKVLLSPVPWAYDAKPGVVDTWNGFRHEREEIFTFLSDHRIDGVFLVSADRHRSDAWRIDREEDYSLYEFESSRLTNQHRHDLMPAALFGYNDKCSFGLLEFDTTLSDPTVRYSIISIDGETIQSLTLRRNEISERSPNPERR